MEQEEEDLSDPESAQQKRIKLVQGSTMPFSCSMRIPFETAEAAHMVKEALAVDEELTPDKVVRSMRVEGRDLVVDIQSTEMRLIKASSASLFDMAMVALRFLCEFDQT